MIDETIAQSALSCGYGGRASGIHDASGIRREICRKTKVNVVGTWANLSIYKEREFPFWTQTISEKSNGAITAEIRAFTEMGLKGGEIFRLMGQGVIEFGSTVLGYVAGDDPENEAVDLAGFSADIDVARAVSEAWKPTLASLYEEKHGIKLLAVFPFHAQVLYCKGAISRP